MELMDIYMGVDVLWIIMHGSCRRKIKLSKTLQFGRKVANIEIPPLPSYASSPSKLCEVGPLPITYLANEWPYLSSYSWYVGKGMRSKIHFKLVFFYEVKLSNKNRFLKNGPIPSISRRYNDSCISLSQSPILTLVICHR